MPGQGIFASVAGKNAREWVQIVTGQSGGTGFHIPDIQDAAFIRLAVHHSPSGQSVYAAFVEAKEFGFGDVKSIYRWSNESGPWQAIAGVVEIRPAFNGAFSLIAHPADQNVFYIAGGADPNDADLGNLHRVNAADPSNAIWQRITGSGTADNSAPPAGSRELAFGKDELGTSVLIDVDDGGIYRLRDPGVWESLNGAKSTSDATGQGPGLRIADGERISYDTLNHVIFGSVGLPGPVDQVGGKDNDADGIIDDPNERFQWREVPGLPTTGGRSQFGFGVDGTIAVRFTSVPDLGGDQGFKFVRSKFDNQNRLLEATDPALTGLMAKDRKDSSFELTGVPFALLNGVDPNHLLIGLHGVYRSEDAGG